MRIVVLNIADGSTIYWPVVFAKGFIQIGLNDAMIHSAKSVLNVLHEVDNAVFTSTEVRMRKLCFKFLLRLSRGMNKVILHFQNVKTEMVINYDQPRVDHVVKLVYIVCKDGDGSFQAPSEVENSLKSAQERLKLAAQVIQTFFSDSLSDEGLPTRTFQLECIDNSEVPTCHILRTELTEEDTWEMAPRALWNHFGRELLKSDLAGEKVKFLAFLSSTKYDNQALLPPDDHAHTLQMTKAHVALGGGGLALFGTGCLWTWPTCIDQVIDNLNNSTPMDSRYFMDDSSYRSTVGGCYATTLGSLLHELGHCFHLGHTDTGIMARGFDSIDSYLSLVPDNRSGSHSAADFPHNPSLRHFQSMSSSIPPDQNDGVLMRTTCSTQRSGFTSLRKKEAVSQYLDKVSYRRLVSDQEAILFTGHQCFWTRSCALILSQSDWLRMPEPSKCHQKSVLTKREPEALEYIFQACCDIIVVEYRDIKDSLLHFDEPSSGTCQLEVDTASVLDKVEDGVIKLVGITACGSVFKQEIKL